MLATIVKIVFISLFILQSASQYPSTPNAPTYPTSHYTYPPNAPTYPTAPNTNAPTYPTSHYTNAPTYPTSPYTNAPTHPTYPPNSSPTHHKSPTIPPPITNPSSPSYYSAIRFAHLIGLFLRSMFVTDSVS
eukprot:TRINITY_DN1255_c0_g1_i1.p1 TRINITY_DN1255_c0_g1~~TRINITY_DN1255_c0_g1_i1.p1  ORF type:complete len:148 (+),score=9.55 TRINITY_DN1255_c0_g1_i1:50-445(+)